MEQLQFVDVPSDRVRAWSLTAAPKMRWKLRIPGERTRCYTTEAHARAVSYRLRARGWVVIGPTLEPRDNM